MQLVLLILLNVLEYLRPVLTSIFSRRRLFHLFLCSAFRTLLIIFILPSLLLSPAHVY